MSLLAGSFYPEKYLTLSEDYPQFEDIITKGSSSTYPSLTFRMIFDDLKKGNDASIIPLFESDSILRDRRFVIITNNHPTGINREEISFLILACRLNRSVVVEWMIKNSDYWYKGPRNLVELTPTASSIPNYDNRPSPIDDIIENVSDSVGGFLLTRILNNTWNPVQFYSIRKDCFMVTDVISSLIEGPATIHIPKNLEPKMIRCLGDKEIVKMDQKDYEQLKSNPVYYQADLFDAYPQLIFKAAELGKLKIFESMLSYYYRQNLPNINSVINSCTQIPLPVAQIITDYCPYLIHAEEVRNVATLTYFRNFNANNLFNSENVVTPFLEVVLNLSGYVKETPFVKIDQNHVESCLKFAKLLLECGERIDRIKWSLKHQKKLFLYSFIKRFATTDVETLTLEIINFKKKEEASKRTNKCTVM